MTYADLAVVYVLGSLAFILSVIVTAIGKVAHRWFCEALDGCARDIN